MLLRQRGSGSPCRSRPSSSPTSPRSSSSPSSFLLQVFERAHQSSSSGIMKPVYRSVLLALLSFCLGFNYHPSWIENLPTITIDYNNNSNDGTATTRTATATSGGGVRRKKTVVAKKKKKRKLKKGQKPVFVLHVGLHKTGTTFLQSVLCGKQQYEAAQPVLLKDNFIAVGTGDADECIPHALSSVFAETIGLETMVGRYPEHPAVKDLHLSTLFRDRVSEALEQNLNAVVVFEELGPYTPDQIRILANFLKPNWDVRVLIAYRPLYSWLPSVQSEVMAYSRPDAWLRPGEPPVTRLPFDIGDGRSYTSIMFEAMERYGKHPAEIVREKYEDAFGAGNVTVLPLHLFPKKWKKGEPLLGHIFCSTLVENPHDLKRGGNKRLLAPNTCRAVENGKIGLSVSANSHTARANDPYLIADGAYERQLVPPESNRLQVIDAVADKYKSWLASRPDGGAAIRACMSMESEKRLELQSWSMELRLFDDYDVSANGTFAGPALRSWMERERVKGPVSSKDGGGEIALRKFVQRFRNMHHDGFRKLVSKNKYCHADVDRLMVDEGWVRFFQDNWNEFTPPPPPPEEPQPAQPAQQAQAQQPAEAAAAAAAAAVAAEAAAAAAATAAQGGATGAGAAGAAAATAA